MGLGIFFPTHLAQVYGIPKCRYNIPFPWIRNGIGELLTSGFSGPKVLAVLGTAFGSVAASTWSR